MLTSHTVSKAKCSVITHATLRMQTLFETTCRGRLSYKALEMSSKGLLEACRRTAIDRDGAAAQQARCESGLAALQHGRGFDALHLAGLHQRLDLHHNAAIVWVQTPGAPCQP